ncbi:MAG: ArsA-related P-loop ATPase [Paracoccus sp. (in: a-proteobacteria)]
MLPDRHVFSDLPELVLLTGKDGTGKTTIAVAVELAARGHEMLLTTTAPAHLTRALASSVPHRTISRIDPEVETQTCCDQILTTKGASLDAQGRRPLP